MGSLEHSQVRLVSDVWHYQLVSPFICSDILANASDHRWRIVKLGTGTGRSSKQAQGRKRVRSLYRCVRPVVHAMTTAEMSEDQ